MLKERIRIGSRLMIYSKVSLRLMALVMWSNGGGLVCDHVNGAWVILVMMGVGGKVLKDL